MDLIIAYMIWFKEWLKKPSLSLFLLVPKILVIVEKLW